MAGRQADVKLSERAGKNEAVVGSAASYAVYVDHGTRHQRAQPYLTVSGEAVARGLKKDITAAQKRAMFKEVKSHFDRSIKNGVEIIKYGNPFDAVELATEEALLNAVLAVTAQAKSLCPVAEENGGFLRNSIMWRTEKNEGGLNEG